MPEIFRIVGYDTDDHVTFISPMVVRNQKNSHKAILIDTDMIKSTFTEEYNTAQTSAEIITPTEGYKLCIRNIEIITDATTGVISLDFVTSNKKVSRLYANVQNRTTSNTAHLVGDTNEPLSLTTTTGTSKVFIVVTYVEHL